MTRAPHTPSPRGFTLVEVLVALTIVALCLAAGLRAAGAMTSNSDRLAINSLAQWCAENELTEMRLTKVFPSIGDNSISCSQLGRDFSVKMSVRGTPNPNFRRVEAQVLDDRDRPLLTITTIVGRNSLMRRATGSSRRAARGFTLIEVVVALVVMAVMSVMAWRAVTALTTSRERNEAAMDRAETLQTLIRQWELDLREVQKSDVFDALTFDGATLRITRRRETGLQLVAWQLKEGRLARWESQTLSNADALRDAWFRSQQLNAREMRELPGLDRVTGWQMYFFQQGAWANAQSSLDKDPAGNDPANKGAAVSNAVPEGVRMRLQFGEDSGYRGELIREVAVEGGS